MTGAHRFVPVSTGPFAPVCFRCGRPVDDPDHTAINALAWQWLTRNAPPCDGCGHPLHPGGHLTAGPVLVCLSCSSTIVPDPAWWADMVNQAYAHAEARMS